MNRALHALGLFSARHSWAVIALWVALVAGVFGAVGVFGSETSNDLELPGTGSQKVKDLLQERFPPQQNGTNPVVFDVSTGKLTDKTNADAVKASVQALRKAPHVYSVTNPVSSNGQTAGLLSKDKQTAFAPVLLDIDSGALDDTVALEIVAAATKPARNAGITVAAAGSLGSELSKQPTESSDLVGIFAAMFILTLVLGSLVAMGLPIISAVVGLAIALGLVGLLGHLVSMPDTGATLATMIGLGVGIDYALFLVSRHQDQLRSGVPVDESVARAVATSGSAIVFAGGTVVVALLSLRVAGIPLLSTLGLASAVAVVTAVLAAISFLPALLGLLGHRIERFAVPAFLRGGGTPGSGRMWPAWARAVARHPVVVTVASLALLVPLIIPAFSLRFGQEDVGAAPKSTTERQAYDLITAGFGVGYNGPLQVASQLTPVATPSKEYTTKYDKATSLQSDLQKKQKQLPKQQKQLEHEQKQLEAQRATLEDRQQQLEDQQAHLEDEKQSLESQQNQLLADQRSLEVQKASLQRQGAALQQRAAQLQAQKAPLERQERELKAQQAHLQAERNRLEAEARSLAARIRPLARQLAGTLARERILERRIARLHDHPQLQALLQARLDQLEQREQQLRADLAPLLQQARKLAAQARVLADKAAALQRRADELEARANRLKAEAAELSRQKAELERQGAALEAEGARLAQQGAQLEDQAAQLQQQAARLQTQGDALQEQGNALQKQAGQLKMQGDQLKAEQQQAKQEQKQAEQLQTELTAMVTAAGGDPRNTDDRVVRLQDALSGTGGIASLTPPQTNKKGDVVLLSAVPSTGPATVRTTEVLADVRSKVLPEVADSGGIASYVGGYTASYVDLATLISERLLLVIGTVILLGFLLLMVAFRSLLIPLQAALTNVLSAAAAFGVLTATFQWGWGVSLVGIDTASSSVPIASYVPLMMFAVLFGLSMDYEVFLVSHIQQHHAGGEPARQAAASGLASSARITTAACLIMTSVFASFILNGDPTIKQFGVGLASAVLLAGVLVVTLAPAAITLMGEAAWWLPRWLDRWLPHVDIEGEQHPPTTVPAQRAAPDGELVDDTGGQPAPLPAATGAPRDEPGPPS